MQTNLLPVLKWAGGKRQLLEQIKKYIPSDFNVYHEPFIGGAAMLLHLQPRNARINDLNFELINLYTVIRDNLDELIIQLNEHRTNHSHDYFYQIRNMDRNPEYWKCLDPISMASRTVYLNKTCYNGLYRVNRNGFFNTPIGRYKNPKILDEERLVALSQYLKHNNIQITPGDYLEGVKDAKSGDFVYFDPPYHPLPDSKSFTSYTMQGFVFQDQIRLKNTCDRLTALKVKFLQSNSDTKEIRELYSDYRIIEVEATRSINSKSTSREKINEILILNY